MKKSLPQPQLVYEERRMAKHHNKVKIFEALYCHHDRQKTGTLLMRFTRIIRAYS